MNQRIEEITSKIADTLKRKNHDYGNSFSMLYKRIGMDYAYGHMAEKLERIWTLMHNDAQVEESINDSLLDLAGYAILTLAHRTKSEDKQEEDIDTFHVGDLIYREDNTGMVYTITSITDLYIMAQNYDENILISPSEGHKWIKVNGNITS